MRRGARSADNRIGYTDAEGIRRCARRSPRITARYGVAVDPAEIVVTTGSSAAFQLAFLAAFEPGDRVALAAPGYPAYRNILSALGLETGADRGRRKRALPAEPRTARRLSPISPG
jgi:aspartate/methionine/tyrosine aminotransferase